MDTKDHKQLILCHVENLRFAIAKLCEHTLKDEPHNAVCLVEPMIINLHKIETLSAQLLGEQTKGKDQPPCSQPLEKSASPSSSSPSSQGASGVCPAAPE